MAVTPSVSTTITCTVAAPSVRPLSGPPSLSFVKSPAVASCGESTSPCGGMPLLPFRLSCRRERDQPPANLGCRNEIVLARVERECALELRLRLVEPLGRFEHVAEIDERVRLVVHPGRLP